MMDMDKRHVQEIQQRDLQLAEMRGTLTALSTRGSRLNPNRSELLDPKILHKVQPFDGHRTSLSRAPGENRRPHQGCSQRRPGPREPGTERAVVLRSGPRDATRECGGVEHGDRFWESTPRQSQETFSPCGPSWEISCSSGFRHCGRHQQDGRGHGQVPKMAGENLSDTHQERHPHEGSDKRIRAATAHASARTR